MLHRLLLQQVAGPVCEKHARGQETPVLQAQKQLQNCGSLNSQHKRNQLADIALNSI